MYNDKTNINPYDEARVAYSKNAHKAALRAQRAGYLKDESFESTYYPIYIGAVLATILCSLYSGVTEFSYFLNKESEGIWLFINCAYAVVGVLLIEGAKNYLLHVAFKSIFKYKKLNKLAITGALLTSMLSAFVAYLGAYELHAFTKSEFVGHRPAVINVDSIKTDYNTQIAAIDTEIQTVREQNTRASGEIRSTAQANINELTKQKELLINNREQAISEAKSSNTNAVAAAQKANIDARDKFQKASRKNAETLSILSVAAEILLVLFAAFIGYYHIQSAYEEIAFSNQPTPSPNGGGGISKSGQQNNRLQPQLTQPSQQPHNPPHSEAKYTAANTAENTSVLHSPNTANTAENTSVLHSPNTAENTSVLHSPNTAENTSVLHSPNTANTAENTSVLHSPNTAEIHSKNTAAKDPKLTILRIVKNDEYPVPKALELTAQKEPLQGELDELYILMQRHQITMLSADKKGLVFEYNFPDAYKGTIRKKSTTEALFKTHSNTYQKRADEAQEKGNMDLAKSNQEKADICKELCRFSQLYRARNFDNQQAG